MLSISTYAELTYADGSCRKLRTTRLIRYGLEQELYTHFQSVSCTRTSNPFQTKKKTMMDSLSTTCRSALSLSLSLLVNQTGPSFREAAVMQTKKVTAARKARNLKDWTKFTTQIKDTFQ
jgi:hypothetical protein